MTKTKNKNVLMLFAVVICALCVVLSLGVNSGAVAYAAISQVVIDDAGSGGGGSTSATTTRMAMTFDYTHYYKYNTSTSVDASGSNVTVTPSLRSSQYGNATIRFYITGRVPSGTSTLANGGAMSSSSVSIEVSSGYSYNTTIVKNSSGTEVGRSNSTSLSLSGLANGTYNVSVSSSSMGWNPNPRAYAGYSIVCTFSFVVDTVSPSISGASTSATGKYTNSTFTVSASDNIGLDSLYMMAPNASYYSAVGSSRTVTAGSANGLYRFYARDGAGNMSSTYYVYYDTTKPTGVIKNASGSTISSDYTRTAFSYTATDAGGISYLQYKTPSSSTWTTYTSGTTIAATAANGRYSFRAVDKSGNYSVEKSIILDTVIPTGTIYGGTSTVASGSITNASYIKFTASDGLSGVANMYVKSPNSSSYATYSSGTQFSVDGTYSFYCVDYAGNASATYTVLLDKTAPTLTCAKTSFYSTYEYGFTVNASDAAGTTKLYYKSPTASSYTLASETSYSVTDAMTNGKYYFYAVDAAGNQSSTVWIQLNVAYPEAQKISSPTDNSVCYTWSGNYTAKLNGSTYAKGMWVRTEGNYTLVLTNESGRSTTYSFSIGHNYTLKQTVSATCSTQGYSLYECSHCGLTYKSDYVATLPHTYATTTTAPTCLAQGYTVYKCTHCTDTFTSNYKAALGHSYAKTTTNPTCLAQGYTVYKCTRCSNTYTSDYTAALGHSYSKTTTAPTCLEQGYSVYKCIRCPNTYTSNYTTALGHNYIETVVEPTCTEEGCIKHACSRCDDSYTTDGTPALGHKYVETEIVATCTEDGCLKHTCAVCGFEYKTNVVEATGHSYSTEVTLVATCTENGERCHICDKCADSYTNEIPALGHNYEITEVNTEDGKTVRQYTCTTCGDQYIQDMGDQYEKVSNYVEHLFELYSPYMWWVLLGTTGVWSIAMGIAIIIARKNEDKEKARKMVVNYCIGLVIIAAIVVACPYLIRGIAALVT